MRRLGRCPGGQQYELHGEDLRQAQAAPPRATWRGLEETQEGSSTSYKKKSPLQGNACHLPPPEAPFNTKLASTRLNCLWQQQATVGLCFWVPPKGQPPLPKRCLSTPSLPLERPCVPHGTEQRHTASFVDLPLSGNSCTTLQLDGDPCHWGLQVRVQ